MQPTKTLDAADYAVFGVLTLLGYATGLYFAFFKNRQKTTLSADGSGEAAQMEAFLGGRRLPTFALAVSVLASAANALTVVSFVGHYYAHGFHLVWVLSSIPLVAIFAAVGFVPLLYGLRVTSIFQYLRLRFDNKVGITACIIYFFLSQTVGALGIHSSAVGLSTMFAVPTVYCSIAIGAFGTFYTAMGGLRGVVWADCVQGVVLFSSPFVIIFKVIYDSSRVRPPLRPLSDFNVTEYMLRTNVDVTTDENLWSAFVGSVPFFIVRTAFDQMSVQRFMAARTLKAAKQITIAGSLFIFFFFLLAVFTGVAIIYWFRDCDPVVAGAIKSYDQMQDVSQRVMNWLLAIVPYYMTQSLAEVPTLRGLFLAGVLGASTSTVSSVVNSNAATFYVDVLTPYVKVGEHKAVLIMRLLAFASGVIMTMFAVAAPAIGTVARAFVSIYSSASGPFAGLVFLAISSPWVNSKGAAWACVLVCGLQVWHAVGRILSPIAIPPLFTGTLERCPLELNATQNFTHVASSLQGYDTNSSYVFPLYRLSFLWICSIGALLTIFLGTVLSLATGILWLNLLNKIH